MTSFVSHTTVDCTHAYELSEWWKLLLGYVDVDGDPNLPGHEECMILDPGSGHRILFIEVPEPKTVKNRLHLDVRSQDFTTAIAQALALGATRANDLYAGGRWQVLRDPEGNEFCILRPRA